MFSLGELSDLSTSPEVSRLIWKSKQFLLEDRLKVHRQISFSHQEIKSLNYFSSLVVGSLAFSEDSDVDYWKSLSGIAADFEYTLFLLKSSVDQYQSRLRHIRRACILYEIAQIPGVSATLANHADFFLIKLRIFLQGIARQTLAGFQQVQKTYKVLIWTLMMSLQKP